MTDNAPRQDTGRYDVVIIGAGICGMYMSYRLRELGLSFRVFEAGDRRRSALLAAKRMELVGYFEDRHREALLMAPDVEAAAIFASGEPRVRAEALSAK